MRPFFLVLWVEFFFAPKQIPEQQKVWRQAKTRILKGCRFVFLEKEMAHPRKTVANKWDYGKINPRKREQKFDEENDDHARANKMQQAANVILVLA